jgi:hypothetical protein
MSSVDALWGVVAVIMIALFYRKSVSGGCTEFCVNGEAFK